MNKIIFFLVSIAWLTICYSTYASYRSNNNHDITYDITYDIDEDSSDIGPDEMSQYMQKAETQRKNQYPRALFLFHMYLNDANASSKEFLDALASLSHDELIASDFSGETVLHIIANYHSPNVPQATQKINVLMRLLRDRFIDLGMLLEKYGTALHLAVEKNNRAFIHELGHVDLTKILAMKNSAECTPLYIAAAHANEFFVRFFADRGADICAKTKRGTALSASMKLASQHPETAEFLLAHPATNYCINEQDSFGQTALHSAILHTAPLQIIEKLVTKGASLTTVDTFGRTPLQLAKDFARDLSQWVLNSTRKYYSNVIKVLENALTKSV